MFLYMLFLLGTLGDQAKGFFERFEAAHKTAPSFEATYEVTPQGMPTEEIKVVIDGNRRIAFSSPAVKPIYQYVFGPKQARELQSTDMIYRDFIPGDKLFLPNKPLGDQISLFPNWVFVTSRKGFGPAQMKWSREKERTISGVQTEFMKAHLADPQQGTYDVEVGIDQAGIIRFYKVDIDGPMTSTHMSWQLKSYKTRTDLSDREFTLELPLGFTPFSLDFGLSNLEIGSKFPLEGWRANRPGDTMKVSLAKGPTLIAMIDGSDPSLGAQKALESLKDTPVVTIATDGSVIGQYSDPGGKALAKVNAPAYPFFALVKPDGTVLKLWMGFDPAKADAFRADILAATKEE